MNYHNIVKDDMRNGVGLRITLFVSGCKHHCVGCHNPQTWNPESGIPFDEDAMNELKEDLNKDYIDGITFSGGDPLFETNRETIGKIAEYVKSIGKTIWLYTGYRLKESEDNTFYFTNGMGDDFVIPWFDKIDVLVDGPFDIELLDQSYHWAGSRNQRVIDVQKSIENGTVVLFDDSLKTTHSRLEDEKIYNPKEVTCGCDRFS